MGEEIVEAVLGEAPDDAKPVEGDINDYAGTYKGNSRGRPMNANITVSGSNLLLSSGEGAPDTQHYIGNDTFRGGMALLTFDRKDGKPARVRYDAGYQYTYWNRQ